jgi:hypothetical protein
LSKAPFYGPKSRAISKREPNRTFSGMGVGARRPFWRAA